MVVGKYVVITEISGDDAVIVGAATVDLGVVVVFVNEVVVAVAVIGRTVTEAEMVASGCVESFADANVADSGILVVIFVVVASGVVVPVIVVLVFGLVMPVLGVVIVDVAVLMVVIGEIVVLLLAAVEVDFVVF